MGRSISLLSMGRRRVGSGCLDGGPKSFRPSRSLVHVPNDHYGGQARKIGDKFADRNILHVSLLCAWCVITKDNGRKKKYSAHRGIRLQLLFYTRSTLLKEVVCGESIACRMPLPSRLPACLRAQVTLRTIPSSSYLVKEIHALTCPSIPGTTVSHCW